MASSVSFVQKYSSTKASHPSDCRSLTSREEKEEKEKTNIRTVRKRPATFSEPNANTDASRDERFGSIKKNRRDNAAATIDVAVVMPLSHCGRKADAFL